MKNVNFKLVGLDSKVIPNVLVDGEVISCKKNEFGSYEANIQTEKDEIEVAISRELELKSRLWWLYALISFIISVFGIFNPSYDRKCISIECLFNFKLSEENSAIKIKFNTLSSSGKAITVEGCDNYEEIKNEYTIDKTAKRRRITLLIIKILVWIGLAILIGWLISKQIG